VDSHERHGPDKWEALRDTHAEAEEADCGEDGGGDHECEAEFRLEDAIVAARHEFCDCVGGPAGEGRGDECNAEEGQVGETDLKRI